MKISKIVAVIIAVFIGIDWLTFIAVGERGVVDLTSVCLMTLVNLTLVFFLMTVTAKTAPMIIMWAVVVVPYFTTRLVALMLVPETMLLGSRFGFGSTELNRALVYLLAAMVATGTGYVLGCRAKSRVLCGQIEPIPQGSSRLMTRLAIVGLCSVLVGYIGLLSFDVANFSNSATPWWYSMLSIFLNQDAALLLIIAGIGGYWRETSSGAKRLIVVFFALYVLQLLLGGSRVFSLRLVFWGLLFALVKFGDFRLRGPSIAKWALIGLLTTIGSFPIATAFKGAWNSQGYLDENTSFFEYALREGPEFDLKEAATQFSFRLAGIDTIVIIVNESGVTAREYLSPVMAVQYVINRVLPGVNPYPDAMFQTSRLYAMAYRGWTLEHVTQTYNSDLWTLAGLSYVYFGWIGGVVNVFLMSALLAALFGWTPRGRQPIDLVWPTFMLSFNHNMFLSMGYETDFINYLHLAISLGLIHFLVTRFPSPLTGQRAPARQPSIHQFYRPGTLVNRANSDLHLNRPA